MEIFSPKSRISLLVWNLAIGIGYFYLARVSLHLAFEHSNATPVWPPSGLALATLLCLGARLAPGIFAGALAANFYTFLIHETCGTSTAIWVSAIIALGNTAEAIAGNFLIRKLTSIQELFRKVKSIFQFILVAIVACMISSTFGATAHLLGGIIPQSIYTDVWFTWWAGDFTGIVVITPLIIVWATQRKFSINSKQLFGVIIYFLLLITISGLVFDEWIKVGFLFTRAFLIIPFLLWATSLFDQRLVVITLLTIAVIATIGTINGHGPLVAENLNESLLTAQAFICVMCITVLVMQASFMAQMEATEKLREMGHDLEQRVISRTEELRTSHAQLMEAQRLARIGSWEWDVINDEITWSDELFKIFGLTPSAFKPGYQNYLKMLHPDDKEWTDSVIREAFRSKVPFDFYHRIVRPDGEVRILHGRGEAYSDNKGNVVKLAGTGQDVTERKTAEDNLRKATLELEQKNKELERSNNELTAFSYVAGHDLQEPLRKIKYFIERILDKETQNLSETGIDYFRRMETSATRMQRLIDDLLTYSRVDIAEKSFENTPINQLLEEVKNELNDSIHQKQATISSGHLFQLKVIPFQFRQLLINIISNSIKFSKPGIPPHIRLEARFVNEIDNLHSRNGMQYYHLKVSDNGIGFEPEFKTRIFEIFQRLHGRKEFEGTGIGLSICKKIVENHLGFITAEGLPGQGATFNIYIEVPFQNADRTSLSC